MTISDEARKLNGLMLEVWACTKPHPEVTPEMLRKLLGRCLPFIRAARGNEMTNQDILDIWQSVVEAMPDATDDERRIAFARAILSARSADL